MTQIKAYMMRMAIVWKFHRYWVYTLGLIIVLYIGIVLAFYSRTTMSVLMSGAIAALVTPPAALLLSLGTDWSSLALARRVRNVFDSERFSIDQDGIEKVYRRKSRRYIRWNEVYDVISHEDEEFINSDPRKGSRWEYARRILLTNGGVVFVPDWFIDNIRSDLISVIPDRTRARWKLLATREQSVGIVFVASLVSIAAILYGARLLLEEMSAPLAVTVLLGVTALGILFGPCIMVDRHWRRKIVEHVEKER